MTQNTQRIDLEAAEWAVRLQLRQLTAQEQAELDHWLDGDMRHRGALLRACAAWADLDRLASLAGGPRAAARPGTQPPPEVRREPAPRLGQPARREGGDVVPHRLTNRRGFMAAGLTMLLIGGVGTWWVQRRGEVYVSAIGEVRSVTLSDGSGMVLNTATHATVHFDAARREVELVAGEGLFQVAKDPQRPFIVRAGSVAVRAVGTVFAVRTIHHRVEVTVTEGVVEVADGRGPVTRVIRVSANEHAIVEAAGKVDVQRMPPDEAERRLAWRDGMLDFAGEPLATAIEEMNRHNNKQIAVDDPALGSRPVVGLFRANDPDGFAATVAAALGLESVDEDGAIRLQQRSMQ
jgi:transmembrane sensor